MESKADFVNLFFMVRVLIVGGFLLILPRITRKGLLFGTYVGESMADQNAVRRLLSCWYSGCLLLIIVSILIGLGISFAGWPVTGNLTGTAVLLLGGLGLYIRFHFRTRAGAPQVVTQQAKKATAPLIASRAKGTGLAKAALGICLLTSIASFVYALVSSGKFWHDGSFNTVMFIPSVNLAVCPFTALLALLIANAKRSLRLGSNGRSVEIQDAFRATMAKLVSCTALLICTFLTLLSIQVIRLRNAEINSLGVGIWLIGGFVFLFILGSLIRIVKRYGQGGSLMEKGSAELPLTNGLADNKHWALGLFYVNKDDPSIMVQTRFGLGYTFNYGNRTVILIVASFLVLCLGLIALGLFGAWMGSG